MKERLIVFGLVLTLAALLVAPFIEKVANVMDANANMIAERTRL